jgi:endogenous inhibitor of DNA gyrase (YacG/DUF329 family)
MLEMLFRSATNGTMNNPQQKSCPACGKASTWLGNAHRPFCSDRCRTIDLGNWATERYRVAGQVVQGEEYEDLSSAHGTSEPGSEE